MGLKVPIKCRVVRGDATCSFRTKRLASAASLGREEAIDGGRRTATCSFRTQRLASAASLGREEAIESGRRRPEAAWFRLPALGIAAALAVLAAGCDILFNSGADPSLNDRLEAVLQEAGGPAGLDFFKLPEPLDYDALPQDPANPITKAKVQLGQLLFHETALAIRPHLTAGLEKYSCSSCHHARAGFQAGIRQALGEGGIGFGERGEARTVDPSYPESALSAPAIRAPSILNVAYQRTTFWNGQFGAKGANEGTEALWLDGRPTAVNRLGYEGIESQAIAGQTLFRLDAETPKIRNNVIYKELFAAAFPELPESQRLSRTTAGLAIAAFERTVVSNKAPFQEWLRGRFWAMSDRQIRGALLFFGKAACVSCHTGPALSSHEFAALGMSDLGGPGTYGPIDPDDPVHLGRGGFTGRAEDAYRFKTPQLYNLADVRYYGHGGSFIRLRDVIAYKNAAQPQNPRVPAERLDPRFKPLDLAPEEIDDLTAFLSDALRDPSLLRYQPEYVPSRNCFPNNDAQTRRDLRCR